MPGNYGNPFGSNDDRFHTKGNGDMAELGPGYRVFDQVGQRRTLP